MKIKKIDIDTLGGTDAPTWGKITALVNGREVTLRLDETQIARFVDIGEHTAGEILGELKAAA